MFLDKFQWNTSFFISYICKTFVIMMTISSDWFCFFTFHLSIRSWRLSFQYDYKSSSDKLNVISLYIWCFGGERLTKIQFQLNCHFCFIIWRINLNSNGNVLTHVMVKFCFWYDIPLSPLSHMPPGRLFCLPPSLCYLHFTVILQRKWF